MPILIYPVTAMFLTYILKFFAISQLFSGHAFILTTLLLGILLNKGFKSYEFAITFTISTLYIYDMVRINKVINFGHSFNQIILGVTMGIILTIILYLGVEKLLKKDAK